MTFRELCTKEVVQLKDGACLGRVDDLELDEASARIESLLLLGRPRLFGLLGRDETLTIPWADIERIGLDAILVRTDIPAAPPSRGGLLDKLRQWLNGCKFFNCFLSAGTGFWRKEDYNRKPDRTCCP